MSVNRNDGRGLGEALLGEEASSVGSGDKGRLVKRANVKLSMGG